ncbi:MAG: T9SS type A sorting domain-containing protein [Tannerella sp.]|jgi:hypothetical protein|nr:T9SS type A sorting domain-containing protein [Tannerella sp.]
MKRKFTVASAGVMLALASMCVPTVAGQEKAAVRTDRVENDSIRERQFQEDETLPDSIIVFSPDGQKRSKQVYLLGEEYGRYVWENNSWKLISQMPDVWIIPSPRYNREKFNAQSSKISYKISDGKVWFNIPCIGSGRFALPCPVGREFEPEYDKNRNLTSFKVIYGNNSWNKFVFAYNAANNPVSIEGQQHSGGEDKLFFKAHYEYNSYGYVTLIDSYDRDEENATWTSRVKGTAEYDAQGKILSKALYEYGKTEYRELFKYYDENYFSSRIYNDKSHSYAHEWKYGTDGKPGACYTYYDSLLSEYIVLYPNKLPASSVESVPGNDAVRVWASGAQLYIAGATSGQAQVYTVAGQLIKTVTFTSGQTAAVSMPPGVYIVAIHGRTWKAAIAGI